MKCAGRYFIEGMPRDGEGSPPPGTTEPERWQPYKLWAGDLWECRGCGAQIISGFGRAPVSERHHDRFAHDIESLCPDRFQVNDC